MRFGHRKRRLDAASNALKSGLNIYYKDLNYTEHALERGSAARAAAYVGITDKDGKTHWAAGIDSDIITASVKALIGAINNGGL